MVEVHAYDHTPVGSVGELVIDVDSGAVLYVVAETGDGNLVPVPFAELSWDAAGFFLLNVDVATFEGAPAFTAADFPDTLQADWDSDIQAYWAM
jgi:hypothetical protein